MIKKELREIIIPAVLRLGISQIPVLVLVILKTITGSDIDILVATVCFFGVGIYWVANHYDIQAFNAEFKDQAFEYLLSLPYSKYRLLYNKLLPRVFVLLWLTFIYEGIVFAILLRPASSLLFVIFPFGPDFFLVGLIFFFFCGFCLGFIESRNRRAGLNFVLFIFFIVTTFGFIILLDTLGAAQEVYQVSWSVVYAALFIMVILTVSFFPLFKKFDLKRVNLYKKKILYRLLPPVVIFSSIAIILIVKHGLR
ncbi:hypothetical protein ACFLRB_06265 [Acidobacteriota bacterium]